MSKLWLSSTPGVWIGPAVLGIGLVLAGVLIIRYPQLLQYLVAAGLIFAGLILLGIAWGMRGKVSYRRMDGKQQGDE